MVKKFIIAVDLGGTNLKIALLDLKYKIVSKQILSTHQFQKKESLILAMISSINNFLQRHSIKKADLLGLGLGLPGPIDVKGGLVYFFPNIPGWKNVPLKAILEKKLCLPVFLDNDANLACLAEYKLGAARGSENAVCLTLGTGVGGGMIIGGNLYRSATFAAGEIGHLPINEKGRRCNCGGIGCLETYIGNQRIKKEAAQEFKRKISLEELSSLAKKGNRQARKIWAGVGMHLGRALIAVVNLLSPDCIVIGGGIANAGKVLFVKVREVVRKEAMPPQARHLRILKAKLGENAGLIGAAVLVRDGY